MGNGRLIMEYGTKRKMKCKVIRFKYIEDHWGEKFHIDRMTEDTLGEGYVQGVLVEKVIY